MKNQKFIKTKVMSLMILACSGIVFLGCNSENSNQNTSDSLMTDTAAVSSSSTDSLNRADSALKDTVGSGVTTDSSGVGTDPAPQL